MPRPERLVVAIHGPVLRDKRQGLGLTVARLAAEVDVSTSYVRQLELGHVRTVGVDVYDRLCRSLRVTDRRVLLADPHDGDTVTHVTRPPTVPDTPPDLDAPDPIDDALDAPDPEDDALDAQDEDDEPAKALAASLAS